MISRTVTITNALGLHARAAARFVHTASEFASRIRVSRGGREMDGKSIMGLLLLAAAQGSAIVISADGADEEAAMAALDPAGRARLRRRDMRLTGLGVSPGVGVGQGARAQGQHAGPPLPRPCVPGAARDRPAGRGTREVAGTAAAAQATDRRGRGRRPRVSVRRAAPDARRRDADRTRVDHHPGRAAERGVGAAACAVGDLHAVRRGPGRVPPRTQGRRRRRGRTPVA